MKKHALILILFALVLAGCAGPNTVEHVANAEGDVAGFWLGLWHGLTILCSWIGSLFSDSISIYEVHNNGGWYNFGFALGVGALGGGASRS